VTGKENGEDVIVTDNRDRGWGLAAVQQFNGSMVQLFGGQPFNSSTVQRFKSLLRSFRSLQGFAWFQSYPEKAIPDVQVGLTSALGSNRQGASGAARSADRARDRQNRDRDGEKDEGGGMKDKNRKNRERETSGKGRGHEMNRNC
jgi:hypothetical protein